jgi:hypothetical protein
VEALLAKRVDFLTITLYWSSNSVSRRICVICSDPCTQTTWNTSENVWRHPLQSSIRRIRAAASPAPSLTVDNALIALAVPLAYAATSEASETLLAPLLSQIIGTANQNSPLAEQRKRFQEEFHTTRYSLLEFLDPHSAKSVIEVSSLLGSKGRSVYPSTQRSGSPFARYRQLCTLGHCFQGLQLIAGTVETKSAGTQ